MNKSPPVCTGFIDRDGAPICVGDIVSESFVEHSERGTRYIVLASDTEDVPFRLERTIFVSRDATNRVYYRIETVSVSEPKRYRLDTLKVNGNVFDTPSLIFTMMRRGVDYRLDD